MTPGMSDAEAKAEYEYRVNERLGILCGDKEPTKEQVALAESEAAMAMLKIEE